MQYRHFGKFNLTSPVIGFGGWPMGKGHYGAVDEQEVIDAIHSAIDHGVTLFDTAAVYGWGEGEELLGRALEGKRDKVVLVSKGGIRWGDPFEPTERVSSREFLTEGLNDSLRRLQTDYIDLYLVHWPDESRPLSEPMEAFAQFQSEGKIRYGGVSNFSIDQMGECKESFPIVCNQVGYHLFDKRNEQDMFPYCRDEKLGVMAYGPLAHGLLTGTMSADTKFEEGDWRGRMDPFKLSLFEGENFRRNLERVDALKEIAAAKGKTVAQLALAWVLSNPVITVALTGARKSSEIEENVEAAEWVMTESERAEISVMVGADPSTGSG